MNRITKHFAAPKRCTGTYNCDCDDCENCEPINPNWIVTPTGYRHRTNGTTVDLRPAGYLEPPDFDTTHCPAVGSTREPALVALEPRCGESHLDYLVPYLFVTALFLLFVATWWRG